MLETEADLYIGGESISPKTPFLAFADTDYIKGKIFFPAIVVAKESVSLEVHPPKYKQNEEKRLINRLQAYLTRADQLRKGDDEEFLPVYGEEGWEKLAKNVLQMRLSSREEEALRELDDVDYYAKAAKYDRPLAEALSREEIEDALKNARIEATKKAKEKSLLKSWLKPLTNHYLTVRSFSGDIEIKIFDRAAVVDIAESIDGSVSITPQNQAPSTVVRKIGVLSKEGNIEISYQKL